VRQGTIKFDDPTRIDPQVDLLAITEYRRSGATSTSASAIGSRTAGMWRITLHAYGDTDNLHLDMTSDPPLAQEDIVLLLLVGMTRAEIDQLQQGAFFAGAALEAASSATGASSAVKNAIPVIDDFRFGSGYSTRTGRTEPQVTVGKRLTDDVRASVTTGLSEDRELRSNIEWRLGQRVSVQGSYDNVNDVSSSTLGNLGVDLRWRLEFR
jgi:translocation and assembly module TamB